MNERIEDGKKAGITTQGKIIPNHYILINLDYQPNEIAWSKKRLSHETKAYIGPLFRNIFKDYKNLENIYTSFPDGEIRRESIEVGGKNVEQLEMELRQNKIQVGATAKQMIENFKVTTSEFPEVVTLISLTIGDMGFTTYKEPTTEELYEKAKHLGLDLCPSSVSIELRLKYKDQPFCEHIYIAMEPINDSNGHPNIFQLDRHDGNLWLRDCCANPSHYWNLSDKVVFCLPK